MVSFARWMTAFTVVVFVPIAPASDPAAKVSFVKDVRPILQANCLGCHQPAKAKGGFIMTAFDSLLAGGESGDPAIEPKELGKSELVARIKGADGKAIMPPGDNRKLTAEEIATIERWVALGATNDTPPSDRPIIDEDHPPTYTRPPVVPSIDVSPDGQFIAVAGFHEVLLHKADGSGIAARLVG